MLAVQGLRVVLPRHQGKGAKVFGPLSFEVAAGGHLWLVGPSGAGKSMLLETLAGLRQPLEGQLSFGGAALDETMIAWLPQGESAFRHMTVMDNISYGLRAKGLAKDLYQERSKAIAAELGIEDHLQSYPGQLSGGERQRMCLARALVLDAKVLLLDEPFAALEPASRTAFLRLLERLRQGRGLTVIHCTHDWHAVGMVPSTVLWMTPLGQGRLLSAEDWLQERALPL